MIIYFLVALDLSEQTVCKFFVYLSAQNITIRVHNDSAITFTRSFNLFTCAIIKRHNELMSILNLKSVLWIPARSIQLNNYNFLFTFR